MKHLGYRWVDKSKMHFKNWAKGQPDHRYHAPCLAIVGGKKWANVNCFHKARFICAVRTKRRVVNRLARHVERVHIAAHRREMARRAAILRAMHVAMIARHRAERQMKIAYALRQAAIHMWRESRKKRIAAQRWAHMENRMYRKAHYSYQIAVRKRLIAEARVRRARALTLHARKRAQRAAYWAGIYEGKARAERRRALREKRRAQVAFM